MSKENSYTKYFCNDCEHCCRLEIRNRTYKLIYLLCPFGKGNKDFIKYK